MIDKKTLADRLKMIRKKRGMTVKALAAQAGLVESTVWAVLLGDSYPRLDTLALICEVMNISLDKLLDLTPRMEKRGDNDDGSAAGEGYRGENP